MICYAVAPSILFAQKFNKDSVLQEFPFSADERVEALYRRPYPFFWHERYGAESSSQQDGAITMRTPSTSLSSQIELTSHTVLDGCMVLTNHALYKCRPR